MEPSFNKIHCSYQILKINSKLLKKYFSFFSKDIKDLPFFLCGNLFFVSSNSNSYTKEEHSLACDFLKKYFKDFLIIENPYFVYKPKNPSKNHYFPKKLYKKLNSELYSVSPDFLILKKQNYYLCEVKTNNNFFYNNSLPKALRHLLIFNFLVKYVSLFNKKSFLVKNWDLNCHLLNSFLYIFYWNNEKKLYEVDKEIEKKFYTFTLNLLKKSYKKIKRNSHFCNIRGNYAKNDLFK